LNANEATIIHVPGGYVNGFQAMEENSGLMVYSDATLQESMADDFRFGLDQWPW